MSVVNVRNTEVPSKLPLISVIADFQVRKIATDEREIRMKEDERSLEDC